MSFPFPRLYPILDSAAIPREGRAAFLHHLGASFADAGITLLEYRNKTGPDSEILSDAAILRSVMPTGKVKLILDDRLDLIEITNFDGVHVDLGDASPLQARELLGPDHIVGTYGGTENFLPGILTAPVDYFSIGPVFPTSTKRTDKPPIGPAGIRRLRNHAGPETVLVAVGGITLATAPEVLAAGATTIAVAAAIFQSTDPIKEVRRWLDEVGEIHRARS